MNILQQLRNLPQKSLDELFNQSKNTKIKKTSRNFLHSQEKYAKNDKACNLLQVKEPFYVYRNKKYMHENCHQKGKCLACQYQKLKQIEEKQKHSFLHSQRNKISFILPKNHTITQRQREQFQTNQIKLLKRKLRRSEGMDNMDNINCNILLKNIQLKVKYLQKQVKQNFYKTTKKQCESPQVIKAILDYVVKSQNSNDSISEILQNIRNLNVKNLLKDKSFLTYLNQEVSKSASIKNTNSTATPQCNLKLNKYRNNIINDIRSTKFFEDLQKNQTSKKKNKGNTKKKKVLIMQQNQSDQQKSILKTAQICSKYIIGDQIEMNDQLKETLQQLANKKIDYFKKALQNLTQLIHQQYIQKQHQQNSISHERLTQKLKKITNQIIKSIGPSDHKQNKKHSQIQKLVKSVFNMPRTAKKAYSLIKKNQKSQDSHLLKIYSEKRVGDLQGQFKSRKSLMKSRRKSKIVQKFRQQSMDGQDIDKETCKQQSQSPSKTDQNKQSQQQYDQILHEQFQNNQRLSNRKSQLKFQPKSSALRHQKNQQILEDYKNFIKTSQFASHLRQHRKSHLSLDSNQNINQSSKIMRKVSSQSIDVPQIFEKTQEEILQQQKQKKCKKFLKIKAAQLLKQNQQLIQKAEKQLKCLSLNNYIINPNDCVLTQKKKIRALRQLMRVKSLGDEADLIFQYLAVYEQNYQILIQKSASYDGKFWNQKDDIDWNQFMNKRQVFSQLMFYNLNGDFIFGRAQEEQINYVFKHEDKDKDKSTEIKNSINKRINYNPTFFQNISQRIANVKIQDNNDLILEQKDKSELCLTQSFGLLQQIKALKLSFLIQKGLKKEQQQKKVDEETFLVTRNLQINE